MRISVGIRHSSETPAATQPLSALRSVHCLLHTGLLLLIDAELAANDGRLITVASWIRSSIAEFEDKLLPQVAANITALEKLQALERGGEVHGELTADQKAALERIIVQVRRRGGRQAETLADKSEAYAYPHADGIACGVNCGTTGFCLHREVRR